MQRDLPSPSHPDARWAAVAARDAAQDGRFFYSVATTGVFCRPSCGARLPRPENVAFHDTLAAAVQAGFRPCRRCVPDGPTRAERQAEQVTRACQLSASAEAEPSLGALAAAAGLSPHHFHRVFKAVTGITPKAYAKAHRAGRLRDVLASAPTVTEALFDAGYASSARFYEDAPAALGMAPRAYRQGGTDTAIRFALAQCSLGALLVADTAQGLCAIALGDDPDALLRDLQDRFPRARLHGGDADFDAWVARVVGAVEQPALGLDLPLDIRGTAFQQRVWQALREIPPGHTCSYAELAPSTVRREIPDGR